MEVEAHWLVHLTAISERQIRYRYRVCRELAFRHLAVILFLCHLNVSLALEKIGGWNVSLVHYDVDASWVLAVVSSSEEAAAAAAALTIPGHSIAFDFVQF